MTALSGPTTSSHPSASPSPAGYPWSQPNPRATRPCSCSVQLCPLAVQQDFWLDDRVSTLVFSYLKTGVFDSLIPCATLGYLVDLDVAGMGVWCVVQYLSLENHRSPSHRSSKEDNSVSRSLKGKRKGSVLPCIEEIKR